jgi:sialate O-acetylesterase
MYDSHKIEGAKVIVKFKYAGVGLASRDAKPLNWFELSDGTKEKRKLVFVKAAAKITGKNTIEVTASGIKAPKFVRFAWNCEARHNLMNKETLPAVSFKTDEPLE